MGQVLSGEDEEEYEGQLNIMFYKNEIKSRPWPGKKIEKILTWKGNYSKLEWNHSYIQWLFPVPEGHGTNSSAQKLFDYEAKEIKENKVTHERVFLAYEMMLDFYGIRIINKIDGRLARSDNWEERFAHLNKSKHNFRRITRIIKSLGELGYEHFQARLVMFLMEETIIHRTIPNALKHAMTFWIEAISDDQERDEIRRRYLELKEPGPSSKRYLDLDEKLSEVVNDHSTTETKQTCGDVCGKSIKSSTIDLGSKIEEENNGGFGDKKSFGNEYNGLNEKEKVPPDQGRKPFSERELRDSQNSDCMITDKQKCQDISETNKDIKKSNCMNADNSGFEAECLIQF